MSLGARAFEKITVLLVLDRGGVLTKRESVARTTLPPRTVPRKGDGFFASRFCFHVDEGVTWIRGWHDKDLEEVAALIAANKLGEVIEGPTGCPAGSTGPVGPSGPHTPPTFTFTPAPTRARFHPIHTTTAFNPRRPR